MLEGLFAQHGGILGVMSVVILLLIKELIVLKNGKTNATCPIQEAGSTPLTKEAHDELCAEKLKNVGHELRELKEGQQEVKEDVKAIRRKLEH
jgi:hypothetical protein